jgi:DNA-binding response OmpR family regulator
MAMLPSSAVDIEVSADLAQFSKQSVARSADVRIVDYNTLPAGLFVREELAAGARAQVIVINVDNDVTCASLLEHGADEAVMRGSPTLLFRLRLALQRAAIPRYIKLGNVELDPYRQVALCAAEEVRFTACEWRLLHCLVEQSPASVSSATLVERVWGDGAGNTANRIHVYICYLRQKLRKGNVKIKNARGVGYSIEVPATACVQVA